MVKRGQPTPRPPQRRPRKKSKVKWRLFGGIVTLGLLTAVVGGALLAFAVSVTQIPTPKEVARAQTTIVMWADGEKEIGRFGEYNRTDVSLTQVPLHVQDAVLAAEDRGFYSHKGFSIQGFTRALFSNIFSGTRVGGSTITQQYAKLAFLTQEKSIIRKVKELEIAEAEMEDLVEAAGVGAGDDQADAGAKTFEREHEMSLVYNARDMVQQTERALDRIENKTYGKCEECGNFVGKARLQVFPRATLCMVCKQKEERR